MPYSQYTWSSGDTISHDRLNNIETGANAGNNAANAIFGSNAGNSPGPFTTPYSVYMPAKLHHYASIFSYGSTPVASYGYFVFGGSSIGYDLMPIGMQQVQEAFNFTNTSAAVVMDRRYLLPPHNALSLQAIKVSLPVNFHNVSGASGTVTIDSITIIIETVSSTGTVTTKATNTVSLGTTTGSMSSNSGKGMQIEASVDYGASPVTTSNSTDRLAVRLQVTAHVTGTGPDINMTMPAGSGYAIQGDDFALKEAVVAFKFN